MRRSEALPYLQKAELMSILKTHEGVSKINQKRGEVLAQLPVPESICAF